MIRFKKSKMILFLVCVFSIFITKVKADIRCFKVPQNKSLLLSNSSKYSPDLKWKTADKSIANVNEYGIVTENNEEALYEAVNNKSILLNCAYMGESGTKK